MHRFYEIASLIRGQSISIDQTEISIDLNKSTRLVENDSSFNEAVSGDSYFWISGGGSVLIQNRYMFVLRRSMDSNINPGKFSLFTGRADNAEERENPNLLIRELFEELLLYNDQGIYYPRLPSGQKVIEKVYSRFHKVDGGAELSLSEIDVPKRKVKIVSSEGERETHLSLHISKDRNDINNLMFFNCDLDLEEVLARDGESESEEKVPREIYLLDLTNSKVAPAGSMDRQWDSIEDKDKSELLKQGISLLQEALKL